MSSFKELVMSTLVVNRTQPLTFLPGPGKGTRITHQYDERSVNLTTLTASEISAHHFLEPFLTESRIINRVLVVPKSKYILLDVAWMYTLLKSPDCIATKWKRRTSKGLTTYICFAGTCITHDEPPILGKSIVLAMFWDRKKEKWNTEYLSLTHRSFGEDCLLAVASL